LEVEAVNARLAEEYVQPVAVHERGAGGVAVIGAFALVLVLRKHGLELLRPERRSRGPVETEKVAAKIFLLAGALVVETVAGIAGDEDAFPLRHGTGSARARQLDAPGDVLRG